jgi:hypothetical protein
MTLNLQWYKKKHFNIAPIRNSGETGKIGYTIQKTKTNNTKTQHIICWTPLCANNTIILESLFIEVPVQGKSAIMYMCVRDIEFAYFYDCFNEFFKLFRQCGY